MAKKTETQEPKLKAFKVVRTPKIRDSRGQYVKRGGTAMLTQELAQHYHNKGYIQISMEGLFDDDDETHAGSGSDETNSGGTQPDQPAGSDDEGSSSSDASADAGTDQGEDGAGTPPVTRRRRTSG